MTAKEAIARIKKQHCSKNNQCTDNCMHGDEYCEYGLALEALEKQIPKKPLDDFSTHAIYDNDGNYLDQIDTRTFKCPICNHILARGEIETTDCAEIHYCDNCGQALDWSDTNGD